MLTISFCSAVDLSEHKNLTTNTTMTNSDAIKSSALGSDADQARLPYLEFDWKQDFLLQQEGLLEALPTTPKNGTKTMNNDYNNNFNVTNKSNTDTDKPVLHC
jgi:hypothetical protein